MVAEWAGKYIGIPFKTRGRDFSGVDCWGVIYLVLKNEFGLTNLKSFHERYETVEDEDKLQRIIEAEKGSWIPVPEGSERPGDAVVLRIWKAHCHIGVVIGDGYMLHALKDINVCREKYNGILWRRRIIGFFRYPGM